MGGGAHDLVVEQASQPPHALGEEGGELASTRSACLRPHLTQLGGFRIESKEELTAVLETLPPPKEVLGEEQNRVEWESWQEGLSARITLPEDLPPLRLLVVWDNLIGHLNAGLLLWMFSKGIMALYSPLGGSWLNMSESIQRILVRRALAGEHPRHPEQIIEWLEAAARGWNRDPTPFEWGGRRAVRRQRARHRRHAVGGSGACMRRPIRRRYTDRPP